MDYGPMSIDAFTYGSHSVKGRCEYMSVATVRFWPKAEAARFRLPIRGLSCGNTLQSRLRHLSRVLERGE